MTQESHTTGTRERLLQVASELFAEKGYAGVSISEITGKAEANKAAVNYHFGSKEKLYQEAWRHAHERITEQIPPDGGVSEDRPPEQRLRGRIHSGLQRAMHGDAIEFRIMRNEMANPTGLLHQVIEDTIGPLRKATQNILAELLGPKATDMDIQLCELCVVSPWLHFKHHKHATKHKGLAPVIDEDMLEPVADHFTAYALAGIRQIRERIESNTDSGDSNSRSKA